MKTRLHTTGEVAGLHVNFEQASAHQLRGPGEDLCERMVPVEKLCQLSLELTQAGSQRRHARMHSCRLALRHATGRVMLWCAVACQNMPVSGNLDVYSGESRRSLATCLKPQP